MDKKELREKYKYIRDNIKNKDILSEKITNKIISSSEYMNSKTICIYVNFGSEVDTSKIIIHALNNKKTVGVPIISKSQMDFYKINSIEEISKKNSFGIYEPEKNDKDIIFPQDINLMIIPGICFDLENNRIGFGKGYYDKYLSNKNLKAIKIGICFSEQVLKNDVINTNLYDVKVDKLIYNS